MKFLMCIAVFYFVFQEIQSDILEFQTEPYTLKK